MIDKVIKGKLATTLDDDEFGVLRSDEESIDDDMNFLSPDSAGSDLSIYSESAPFKGTHKKHLS